MAEDNNGYINGTIRDGSIIVPFICQGIQSVQRSKRMSLVHTIDDTLQSLLIRVYAIASVSRKAGTTTGLKYYRFIAVNHGVEYCSPFFGTTKIVSKSK